MAAEILGRCDKKQYEHCGPHPFYSNVGQRMPPFGCLNWKAESEGAINVVQNGDLLEAEERGRRREIERIEAGLKKLRQTLWAYKSHEAMAMVLDDVDKIIQDRY